MLLTESVAPLRDLTVAEKVDHLSTGPEELSEWLRDAPLYSRWIASTEAHRVLTREQLDTDLWCGGCEKETCFRSRSAPVEIPAGPAPANAPRPLPKPIREFEARTFLCTRCQAETAHFVLQFESADRPPDTDDANENIKNMLMFYRTVRKVGEAPSRRERSSSKLARYRKHLSKADYNEFNAAIGLHAHGIGIGSYVYLRRILERRVGEASERMKTARGLSDAEFDKWKSTKRIIEKVEDLREFLPKEFFDLRRSYSVLSKGIHELSEEDCKRRFESLRLAIELIHDAEIERQQKARKLETLKRELEELAGRRTD